MELYSVLGAQALFCALRVILYSSVFMDRTLWCSGCKSSLLYSGGNCTLLTVLSERSYSTMFRDSRPTLRCWMRDRTLWCFGSCCTLGCSEINCTLLCSWIVLLDSESDSSLDVQILCKRVMGDIMIVWKYEYEKKQLTSLDGLKLNVTILKKFVFVWILTESGSSITQIPIYYYFFERISRFQKILGSFTLYVCFFRQSDQENDSNNCINITSQNLLPPLI